MANKGFFETRGGRVAGVVATIAAGTLVFEHAIWPSLMGQKGFEDTLALRVDSVAAGKPFNPGDPKHPTDGLRVEKLPRPTTDVLAVASYNVAENAGAEDPSKPEPRIRAIDACGILALNVGLDDNQSAAWGTARRADTSNENGDNVPGLYGEAAKACESGLAVQIKDHADRTLLVPIDLV